MHVFVFVQGREIWVGSVGRRSHQPKWSRIEGVVGRKEVGESHRSSREFVRDGVVSVPVSGVALDRHVLFVWAWER